MRCDRASPDAARSPAPGGAPFDGLAAGYDAAFTRSPVGRALRGIVWRRLQEGFASCRTVLELGCGTGEDALWLAGRGVSVVATDVSAAMIEVARSKAESAGCADRLELRCVAMEEIGAVFAGRRFDGVLSDFGAVNCARDLRSLIAEVSALLEPGGKLLWVLMGRHVPWEWIWYARRGEWAKVGRRTTRGGLSWRGVRVSYPTPGTVTRWLSPAFRTDRVTPLGVFLPPTYAAGWLDRSPGVLGALTALERLARRSSALARLSDHYIIEATRR